MDDNNNGNKITSRFFNLPFTIFFFIVLVISVSMIEQSYLLGSYLLVMSASFLVFVVNFLIGYYTVINLYIMKSLPVEKKRQRRWLVFLLMFTSYLVVPLVVTLINTHELLWGEDITFIDLFLKIFGVNLLVNTLLIFLYYNSITVSKDRETPAGIPLEETPANFDVVPPASPPADIVKNSETETSQDSQEYLLLRSNRALTRIRIDEIVYLEVTLNTVLIQTVKRFYETRSTLGEIIRDLPNNFFQISKSVVINLDFFEELVFESESKRSKAKISFRREEEAIEESFYIGRKFLAPFKTRLSD